MVKCKAMKKYFLIVSLLLGMSAMSMAQASRYNQKKEPVSIGIKGGINIPQMTYLGNKPLSKLDQSWSYITPTGGLFVEIPIGSVLIIAPEVMYVQRGTDVEYEHISGTQVHYNMNVSYGDFRLPFELRIPINQYSQPYVVAGAEVGMRLFGTISIKRSVPVEMDETIDVGDANMGLIHAGAFAGLGIRSRFNIGYMGMVVKLSASYHQGFLDTYSKMETEGTAEPVNVNAYVITGSRLPRGLEATLGISIPIEKRPDDACASFSKNRRWIKRSGRGLFGF